MGGLLRGFSSRGRDEVACATQLFFFVLVEFRTPDVAASPLLESFFIVDEDWCWMRRLSAEARCLLEKTEFLFCYYL